MEVAATPQDTTLPLRLRLRRAVLVALLLGLWAPVKLAWEQRIAREQNLMRYNSVTVSPGLRDQLSQGLTIGLLSGMRNVVADFVWLQMVTAWMNQDWWKMGTYINVCTALQPRAPLFWEMGGWHLGWNAALAAEHDAVKEPDPIRRLKYSRFWTERGRDILLRGVDNNPDTWRLLYLTGLIYDQRLHDFKTAAYYYQRSSEQPEAPVYLERDAAHMYDHAHMNDPAQEYVEWVKLWRRLTPEEKKMPVHTPEVIRGRIRQLEEKLAVPNEKRIFPK